MVKASEKRTAHLQEALSRVELDPELRQGLSLIVNDAVEERVEQIANGKGRVSSEKKSLDVLVKEQRLKQKRSEIEENIRLLRLKENLGMKSEMEQKLALVNEHIAALAGGGEMQGLEDLLDSSSAGFVNREEELKERKKREKEEHEKGLQDAKELVNKMAQDKAETRRKEQERRRKEHERQRKEVEQMEEE